MKYFFSVIIWFLSVQLVCAQDGFPDVWKQLKVEINTTEGEFVYFLTTRDALKQLSLSGQSPVIVKQLDNEHIVVKNVSPGFDKMLWPVNNLWKVAHSVEAHEQQPSSTYIVRSICNTELTGNNQLQVQPAHHLPGLYIVEGKQIHVLAQFLNNDCVTYIGKESIHPKPEATVLDLNLTYNKVTTVRSKYPDLDGSNLVVSVKENQYDVEDLDLLGKNLPSGIASSRTDNHATDMATIIGGKGNSSVRGLGVAPAVSLSSSDFSDIVPDSDEDYDRLSVYLQNHSYGTVVEHFYGTLAEAYDASSYRNPDILHVFSAGNIGNSTTTEGLYQGIPNVANLTGNFKGAKNTLTIGSVDSIGNVFSISSRGPTYDGRVKPELVTYSMFGTSNSAAIVTGTGVLLHQAYTENFGGLPTSALLKALLINSADDADVPGVDFKTGFGALNADRAVRNTLAGSFLEGEVADGGSLAFDLTIPENAVNLKITLVWTDSAATAGAVTALVNDLDLSVVGEGETWLPWVLNSSREGINLPATRGVDHLNNVEQVTIKAPVAGNYQISVAGYEVASATQQFAIAYQYDIEDNFSWSYPLRGDNVPFDGEVTPYIQWESSFPQGTTGVLEYTLDDGVTWNVIRNSVDLNRGFFRWDSYPRQLAISTLRMVVDGVTYMSEEFTLSSPKKITLGFDCGDSLLFFWDKDELAIAYEISNLENTSFSLIQSITDTSFIIKKTNLASPFISVDPVLANDQKALGTGAVNYQFQGGNCYFSSIFPVSVPEENRIILNGNMGTNYQVASVVIERKNRGDFEEIGSFTPQTLDFRFNDPDPQQGINTYRAVAILTNGNEVTSDETEIYFLTTDALLVFPNPVERPEALSIFSREMDGQVLNLAIYNYNGQLIQTDQILGDRYSISTAGFNEGVYFYRVTGSGIDESGRFVVK